MVDAKQRAAAQQRIADECIRADYVVGPLAGRGLAWGPTRRCLLL